MRRSRGFAAALALAALASGAVAPARGAAKADWVLVALVAGPDGSSPLDVEVDVSGHGTGDGPLVAGWSVGFVGKPPRDPWSYGFARTLGGDGISVSASVPAGVTGSDTRLQLDAVPGDGGTFTEEIYFSIGELRPRESAAVLLYYPGGVIDRLSAAPDDVHTFYDPERARLVVKKGSGSHALLLSDAVESGAAFDAGPSGAGMVTVARGLGRGIVGHMHIDCECTGSWSGPRGRSGTWTSARVYLDFPLFFPGLWEGEWGFAGPAGRWSWLWNGAAIPTPYGVLESGPAHLVSSAAIGAYAPIGDDWRLFRGPSGCCLAASVAAASWFADCAVRAFTGAPPCGPPS